MQRGRIRSGKQGRGGNKSEGERERGGTYRVGTGSELSGVNRSCVRTVSDTNNISLHIKDTLDSLTSDLHVKLDQHIQATSETAQTQKELTENLIQAQKHLNKTTQKAISTTKTYSQAAAAILMATAPTQTPPPPDCQG